MFVKKRIWVNLIATAVIFGLIWFCLPLLLPAHAAGNIYYVAKNGSDSNIGTEAQPLLTIQKAADTAQAGDAVYVKAGTYEERVTISNSGTSENRITFKNYPSDTVKVSYGFKLNGDYTTIDGFEISPGPAKPGLAVDFSGDNNIAEKLYIHDLESGVFAFRSGADRNLARSSTVIRPAGIVDFLDGSSNNTIDSIYVEGFSEGSALDGTNNLFQNSEVNGNRNGSDLFYPGGQGNAVRGCKIYGIHNPEESPEHTDMFQWWSANPQNFIVENNVLGSWHVTSWGSRDPDNTHFMISTDIPTTGPIIIRNNVFLGGGNYVIMIGEDGGAELSNFMIYNNVFYTDGSVEGYGNSRNWRVMNNIFTVASAGNVLDYNIFWQTEKPPYEGSHSFEANPLFVNPDISAATNYGVNAAWHLQVGSPAIDAGISDDVPTTDKEGKPRYDDPSTPNTGSGTYPYYDIGAYEYSRPIANPGGPYKINEGKELIFDGSASYDPEGDPLTYDWDFGDQTFHGSGISPTHAYMVYGTYRSYDVALIVNDGNSDSLPSTTKVDVYVRGDINLSGKVDIFDLIVIAKAVGSKPGDSIWNPAADLNFDDGINIFDLVIAVRDFGKSI